MPRDEAAEAAELEVGAQARIAHEALRILLHREVVSKKLAIDHPAVAPAEAARGIDAEDKGDDDGPQHDRKDGFEVVLKVALNPGNHG